MIHMYMGKPVVSGEVVTYDDTEIRQEIADLDRDKLNTSNMKNTYGIEANTVPTIESKVEENRVALGYSGKNLLIEADTDIISVKTIKIFNVNTNGDFNNYILSVEKLDSTASTPSSLVLITFTDGSNKYVEFNHQSAYQEITVKENKEISKIAIYAGSNYELSQNHTVTITKIMLRPASITDDTYEPYKPSVDERLKALEAAILNS